MILLSLKLHICLWAALLFQLSSGPQWPQHTHKLLTSFSPASSSCLFDICKLPGKRGFWKRSSSSSSAQHPSEVKTRPLTCQTNHFARLDIYSFTFKYSTWVLWGMNTSEIWALDTSTARVCLKRYHKCSVLLHWRIFILEIFLYWIC